MALTHDERRFWKRVAIGDGCWEWTAAVMGSGYGAFMIAGKQRSAHRVSFAFKHGDIPAGLVACHRCDNKRCVRPSHLFLGTQAENLADMTAKGRRTRGAATGKAKLTEDDVRTIRRRVTAGETMYAMAREYGVGAPAIFKIMRRHVWRHVN